ncbi:lipid particle protein [Pseudohyphozyma bogoriensis]|nr:lipid particle protein [Pseudohyphozyma bogoriensis]
MPYPVHLLVVTHGLWGTRKHVGYIAKSALEHAQRASAPRSKGRSVSPTRSTSRIPAEKTGVSTRDSAIGTVSGAPAAGGDVRFVVLSASMNEDTRTYDGIDICAERVVEEIDSEIARIEEEGGEVTRFSIVGYSLGGLVARYVLGLLESRTPSFFSKVRPVNFTTFASPAIGIPRYQSFWSVVIRFLGARLLSRTGSQLYEKDRFLPASFLTEPSEKSCKKGAFSKLTFQREKAEPLLAVLADPRYNFYKALAAFERIDIYANSVQDRTVPYITGGIVDHDPFALARARAKKAAELRGEDPEVEPDIIEGGLEIPFSRPVSLAVIVFLPIALPAALCYLVGRFLLQGRESKRRIRDIRTATGGGREGVLARVGLGRLGAQVRSAFEEVSDETLQPDNPEHEVETSHLTAEDLEEENTRLKHPSFAAFASYGGTETPPIARAVSPALELRDESKPEKRHPTDPILSEAQKAMIKNLNALPQMKKHLSYFPHARNAHGKIIARDLSYVEHREGMKVVDAWASQLRI